MRNSDPNDRENFDNRFDDTCRVYRANAQKGYVRGPPSVWDAAAWVRCQQTDARSGIAMGDAGTRWIVQLG